MKLSRREGVMIAVCVLVVLFIGLPSLKQLRGLSSGKSTTALSQENRQLQQTCVRLHDEIAGLNKEVNTLTWKQTPDQIPPLLLKEIQQIATGAGVTVASFRPGRPTVVAAGGKLPVTVQVTAPFPKAALFLEKLRDTDSRVALERMQFAATDANSSIVGMELRLAVYTATPPAPVKSSPSEGTRNGRTT